MVKIKIFSREGWKRQKLKILLAEREIQRWCRDGLRLVVLAGIDYHLSSKN